MNKKYVTVNIDKNIYEILKKWNEERKNQDNRCTRTPIFTVQSKRWIPTLEGCGERERLYIDSEGSYIDMDGIEDGIMESIWEDIQDEVEYNHITKGDIDSFMNCDYLWEVEDKIKELGLDYYFECLNLVEETHIWEDVAYFMTEKEAFEYTKYQAHNLGECRTYGMYIGYSNRSSLSKFLEIIDGSDIFGGCNENMENANK